MITREDIVEYLAENGIQILKDMDDPVGIAIPLDAPDDYIEQLNNLSYDEFIKDSPKLETIAAKCWKLEGNTKEEILPRILDTLQRNNVTKFAFYKLEEQIMAKSVFVLRAGTI